MVRAGQCAEAWIEGGVSWRVGVGCVVGAWVVSAWMVSAGMVSVKVSGVRVVSA